MNKKDTKMKKKPYIYTKKKSDEKKRKKIQRKKKEKRKKDWKKLTPEKYLLYVFVNVW